MLIFDYNSRKDTIRRMVDSFRADAVRVSTDAPLLAQLRASGYLYDFSDYAINGDTLMGTVDLSVVERLKEDRRFASGVFYHLHRDVGTDLIDFRSYNGALGKGSLQFVIDRVTGRCYCDLDQHNPYQDVVRAVGHLFGEVLFGWLRRR